MFFGPGDVDAAGGPVAADSYWRPSRADVAPFEAALDSALSAAQTERSHNRPSDLDEYSVQYVGYVLDGSRLIYANAACGDIPDAETRWHTVLDGGACYFGVSFDVDAGRLIDLRFNGEA